VLFGTIPSRIEIVALAAPSAFQIFHEDLHVVVEVKGLEVLAGSFALNEGQLCHGDTETLQVGARDVKVYFVAFFADMADLVDHLRAAWRTLSLPAVRAVDRARLVYGVWP
jgi:hypothetical protein